MKLTFPRLSILTNLRRRRECYSQARGVPLPTWENVERNKPDPDKSSHTTTCHPRPSKQNRPDGKKRACQEDDSLEKISLADGRMAISYHCPPSHILIQDLGPLVFHVLYVK